MWSEGNVRIEPPEDISPAALLKEARKLVIGEPSRLQDLLNRTASRDEQPEPEAPAAKTGAAVAPVINVTVNMPPPPEVKVDVPVKIEPPDVKVDVHAPVTVEPAQVTVHPEPVLLEVVEDDGEE